MPDTIRAGEALEFIWLEARDQPVRRLIDSADADPREGFRLRGHPTPRPTASPEQEPEPERERVA